MSIAATFFQMTKSSNLLPPLPPQLPSLPAGVHELLLQLPQPASRPLSHHQRAPGLHGRIQLQSGRGQLSGYSDTWAIGTCTHTYTCVRVFLVCSLGYRTFNYGISLPYAVIRCACTCTYARIHVRRRLRTDAR